jgi:hypothetical protein
MDLNNDTPIFKKLSNLYYNQTFFDKYGTELLIVKLTIVGFISLSLYFHIKNHLPYYKNNWNKYKCSPAYMPLAGFIQENPSKSTFRILQENLQFCTQNILKNQIDYFLIPIKYIYYISKVMFEQTMKRTNKLRSMFSNMRSTFGKSNNLLQKIISKIIFAIHTSSVHVQDLFYKLEGLMAATGQFIFGAYLTFKSFIVSVLGTINNIILAALYATIISLIAAAPVTFGASLITAAAQVIVYIAIMIPLIMLNIGFSQILNTRPLSIKSPPKV